MSDYPLIGLIGKKRSGKDSVASVFTERYGWRRVAFADPLREAALRLDPLVGDVALPDNLTARNARLTQVIEAIGWEAAKDFVPEVRRTLERLGTDAIRQIDDEFWLRAAIATIEETEAPVIVTDCRFPNEADEIVRRGGIVVRVVRPFQPIDRDEHISARALDTFPEDVTIYNDGTLQDLYAASDQLARSYLIS